MDSYLIGSIIILTSMVIALVVVWRLARKLQHLREERRENTRYEIRALCYHGKQLLDMYEGVLLRDRLPRVDQKTLMYLMVRGYVPNGWLYDKCDQYLLNRLTKIEQRIRVIRDINVDLQVDSYVRNYIHRDLETVEAYIQTLNTLAKEYFNLSN